MGGWLSVTLGSETVTVRISVTVEKSVVVENPSSVDVPAHSLEVVLTTSVFKGPHGVVINFVGPESSVDITKVVSSGIEVVVLVDKVDVGLDVVFTVD